MAGWLAELLSHVLLLQKGLKRNSFGLYILVHKNKLLSAVQVDSQNLCIFPHSVRSYLTIYIRSR